MTTSVKNKMWYIRTPDGNAFGPADFATIKEWASDGRLTSRYEVSTDKTTWQSITVIDGLNLNWIVCLTNNEWFGAIHEDAINELIANGEIAADAPIFFETSPKKQEEQKNLEKTLEKTLGDVKIELENEKRELHDLHIKYAGMTAERTKFSMECESLKEELLKANDSLRQMQEENEELKRRLADAESVTQTIHQEILAAEIPPKTRFQDGPPPKANAASMRSLEAQLVDELRRAAAKGFVFKK